MTLVQHYCITFTPMLHWEKYNQTVAKRTTFSYLSQTDKIVKAEQHAISCYFWLFVCLVSLKAIIALKSAKMKTTGPVFWLSSWNVAASWFYSNNLTCDKKKSVSRISLTTRLAPKLKSIWTCITDTPGGLPWGRGGIICGTLITDPHRQWQCCKLTFQAVALVLASSNL